MSWWYKMPVRAGHRPEIVAIGWDGFCAWLALIDVNAQEDFGGRLPRRFVSPAYLVRQLADGGPDVTAVERGLEKCIQTGMASWDDDGHLVLDDEILEDWRAPMSSTERSRKHRTTKGTSATRGDTARRHATDATRGTPGTLPDQTRPDQTRPESEPPAPAHHGPTSFDRGALIPASVDHDTTAALIAAPVPNGGPSDIQAEAWRLAQLHDQLGMAVAKTHGASWRSLQNSGPRLWLTTLRGGETEDACRHVLTILAAEADERARLSVRDPLRFLRTPTTPDIWLRATGLPDEETARESVRARTASGRGPGGGQDPSPEPARRLKRLG
jgi:hypothetical protein